MLLDGKKLRDEIRHELAAFIAGQSEKPTVVIIQVGDRSDSNAYICQKIAFADSIGARAIHDKHPTQVTEEVIETAIRKHNADTSVHGIILQMPLPAHLDAEKLLEIIAPEKDVDGLTAININALYRETGKGFMPATARGILTLLERNDISIKGKRITVIGRSAIAGKPTAMALLNKDATVTIAHKQTEDLAAATKGAEILVVAIGDPEFIDEKYISPGQVVIDVGINRKGEQLVGDVARSRVEHLVQAISPVPGGVGPMTVASLFQNLCQAYSAIKKIRK